MRKYHLVAADVKQFVFSEHYLASIFTNYVIELSHFVPTNMYVH